MKMIETQNNNNVVESLEDSNDPGWVTLTYLQLLLLTAISLHYLTHCGGVLYPSWVVFIPEHAVVCV